MAKSDPALPIEAFAAALPALAPILGLDVGTKTIGVALSDPSRTIATARPSRSGFRGSPCNERSRRMAP